MAGNRKPVRCSFCGRGEGMVEILIEGIDGFICSDCIETCWNIIGNGEGVGEVPERKSADKNLELISPKSMKERLDEYVIGQDDAKKALAVAVYNHYKRINALKNKDQNDVEIQKSNVLLIGPTGVGKTYLAQTLARILNVPFAIADATSLTEAGYVGEDVENILLRLIQAADGDVKQAERGIIFVDEIDKISRRGDNPSITRDVSGEGVQQALLKILEGTVANVPPTGGRKHPHQEFIQIDTSNILFICSGAFDGLSKVIDSRLGKNMIGFSGEVHGSEDKKDDDLLKKVEPEDLLKFGLIPEFIGRVPTIVTLKSLDKTMLRQILTQPKNALIKQYKKLFETENVELEFEEDAIDSITEIALERKTGARGLRAIIETAMMDAMFEVPSMTGIKKCIVTKETITKGAQPKLLDNDEKVLKLSENRNDNKETA